MRGRNKPWAKDFILEHDELVYKDDEIIDMPKTLEVGIGKGDFIIANAKYNPDYMHFGVEMSTSIFGIAMKKIVSENLSNIRLLNVMASDLPNHIQEGTIEHVYLNFSDPWPQNPKRRKRLVHAIHLSIFEKLLKDGGSISFKTDNYPLFEMAVKNFNIRNYKITFLSYDYDHEEGDFVTEYETRFRNEGMPIYRICAIVNKNELKPWNDAIK